MLRAAVNAVVVVKVRECLGVGEVVDCDKFEVFDIVLCDRTHDAPADAAKAVDRDLGGHGSFAPRSLARQASPASRTYQGGGGERRAPAVPPGAKEGPGRGPSQRPPHPAESRDTQDLPAGAE